MNPHPADGGFPHSTVVQAEIRLPWVVHRPGDNIPPFDPRWLEALALVCGDLRGGGSRFQDLFLEQRLELRAVVSGGDVEIEECRVEGVGARWRSPTRTVLQATTGVSAPAVNALLARHADRSIAPRVRPVPAAELDPPRGWLDWAHQVAGRFGPDPGVIRYIRRRAAVVLPNRWIAIDSPPLVRVERAANQPCALLAVWGHPDLGTWLREFFEPEPGRVWEPKPGSEFPVVLTNGTAGVLMHELAGHMAEADLVASRTSPLGELVGAKLTASSVSLTDDPTQFDLPGAFGADDEGVVAAPIAILQGGVLKGLLCDQLSAKALGQSPGRGRRASWNRHPAPRLSNLVMAPGHTPPADLEAAIEAGIVVTRVGRATVDPLSLRCVLRVERGWEIRNGRRRRPLAPCELTGSVLQILAAVDDELGDDPTVDWRLGWCVKDGVPLPTGSTAPTLRIRRLEVL